MPITIGQHRLTMRQAYELPIGTVVRIGGTDTYRKDHDGFYQDRRSMPTSGVVSTGRTVEVVEVGPVEHTETLHSFKQRLATMAIGHARTHSIRVDLIMTALNAIGVEVDNTLRPGMWVNFADTDLVNELPTGTLLVSGSPEHYLHHRLYEYRDGTMHPLIGGRNSEHGSVLTRVVTYPEGTLIGTWEGGAEDETEAIHLLRREVWDKGYQAKSVHQWCAQFEYLVARMFVDHTVLAEAPTEPAADAPEPERRYSYDEQAAFLEGTVFQYSDPVTDATDWCWVVRHDLSTYPARTYHLCGPNSGQYGSDMVLLHNPATGPMSIRVVTHDQMDRFPQGSVVQSGGETWVADGSGQWTSVRTAAMHPSDRFALSEDWRLVYLPDSHMNVGQDPTAIVYGQPVTRSAALAAPIGTEMTQQDGRLRWRKTAVDHWETIGEGLGINGGIERFTLSNTLTWAEPANEEDGLVLT